MTKSNATARISRFNVTQQPQPDSYDRVALALIRAAAKCRMPELIVACLMLFVDRLTVRNCLAVWLCVDSAIISGLFEGFCDDPTATTAQTVPSDARPCSAAAPCCHGCDPDAMTGLKDVLETWPGTERAESRQSVESSSAKAGDGAARKTSKVGRTSSSVVALADKCRVFVGRNFMQLVNGEEFLELEPEQVLF